MGASVLLKMLASAKTKNLLAWWAPYFANLQNASQGHVV